MKHETALDFGLAIAYVIPGFVALWGLSFFSPTVRTWFSSPTDNSPAVAGFLYVLLASTAVGLIVSAIRWAVIDRVHAWTGLPSPQWDYAALNDRLPAFQVLVQHHYRYYQFYSNLLVAVILAYSARSAALRIWPGQGGWTDGAVLLVVAILIAGSRDTLRKYHQRGSGFLKRRS